MSFGCTKCDLSVVSDLKEEQDALKSLKEDNTIMILRRVKVVLA